MHDSRWFSGVVLTCVFVLSNCYPSTVYSQGPDTQYQVIELGECTAEAINDHGEIALWIGRQGSDFLRSYVWKDGELTLLTSGDQQTKCVDINNNSYVVGALFNSSGPVMWDGNRSFIPLDIPEGYTGNHSSALGINDFNEVVGFVQENVDGYTRAFIYNGHMTVLPVFAGYESSVNIAFLSINNIGEAIGQESIVGESATFVWFNGIHTILDDAMLMDINNAGHIAGYYVPDGSGWTIGNRAGIWIDNVPYLYDNGAFEATRGFALNDSSVMVGQASYPPGLLNRSRAVKYVDEQIIDLNTVINTNEDFILEHAVDINNNGEIITWGYYLPKDIDALRVSFLLRPIASKITHPGLHDLLIAGIADTIRWNVSSVGQKIDLEYTVDGGESYRPINSEEIAAEDGEYEWVVPDSLIYRHVLIKMTDHDTGDSLAVSEEFSIKPYVITRVGDDGEYEAYEFDTHRFGFGNTGAEMWPATTWNGFDYQNGTDPFTHLPYSFSHSPVFVNAWSDDFPDWVSFVNAFTVNACYRNPALAYYSLTALARWEAIKHGWNGSCFGIANANGLAFNEEDSFRTKFPGYPNYVNPIDVTAVPAVIPVISELFAYQYGEPYKAHDIERRANSYPTETVEQLKQIFSEDDVPVKVLAIYNNNGNGGHEILPYRLEQDSDDPEYYYIYLWDNSYPNNENAMIVVDTSANGNRGLWNSLYAWQNWGGEKYLYLDKPVNEFISNPTLAKPASPQAVFAVPYGAIEIDTSGSSSVIITDASGNRSGFVGSSLLVDIPDATPLYIKNGNETSPYGYSLPDGAYTIKLSDFTKEYSKLFFFTENETFIYGGRMRNRARRTGCSLMEGCLS